MREKAGRRGGERGEVIKEGRRRKNEAFREPKMKNKKHEKGEAKSPKPPNQNTKKQQLNSDSLT